MAIQVTRHKLDALLKKDYRLEIRVDDDSGSLFFGLWGMKEGRYLSSADADIEDLPDEFQAVYSQYLLLKN